MARVIIILTTILGAAMAANGIFMLSSPEIWFSVVPGVGRTGLFNQHFIRDIGILYIFIGGGFVYGALNPAYRLFLWTSATLWLTCHAIFHYLEVMTGICSPSYLITEFPAVTLPAVIGVIATLYALGSHRRNLAQHNK